MNLTTLRFDVEKLSSPCCPVRDAALEGFAQEVYPAVRPYLLNRLVNVNAKLKSALSADAGSPRQAPGKWVPDGPLTNFIVSGLWNELETETFCKNWTFCSRNSITPYWKGYWPPYTWPTWAIAFRKAEA